jgi:N6-L-threonylcarbamoyladenine synthase
MHSAIAEGLGIPLYAPSIILCTDNAAAIGAAAHWRFVRGQTSPLELDIVPNLKLFS